MIFEHTLVIRNSELKITTIKELSKKEKEDLEFMVETFSVDINHNVADSSAWRFNNSQALIAIYLNPEFIQYFKYVLKIFTEYKDTFNPYSISSFNPEHVVIDEVENVIIKNIDFNFDTSYFRSEFICEFVEEFLKEVGIKEFLLEFDKKYIAQGKKGWIIKCGNFEYRLINSKTVCFNYEPSGFKSHKFGAIDNDLKPTKAFMIGYDLSALKVLAPQVNYVNTKTDLKRFCEENKIEVVFENN